MRILVVDKVPMSAQFIKSKLETLGHMVQGETSKNNAVRLCKEGQYDIVFLDPSPLTSPRTLILDIRRSAAYYPYTILMTETNMNRAEGLKFGVNDVFHKPLNPALLDEKVQAAKGFLELYKHIGDDTEDFPSAGGVIAKSAYNQLFRSAIDRADRYGEETFMLMISLSSYNEIAANEGPYAADFAVAKLSQYLVQLRRQSDIIGQTGANEYSLLLQRPMYPNEPSEAAGRFTEALVNYEGFKSLDTRNIEITVKLVALPSGEVPVNNVFNPLDHTGLGK